MNPDQIIQWAREAGWICPDDVNPDWLRRQQIFAQLVASHEMERCAKVCDAQNNIDAAFCAQAIRALKD